MAIVKYKPTTNGRRNMSTLDNKSRLTKSTPEKSLLAPLHGKGGRGNTGRITSRHQGGGVKQKYRIVDFKRNKDNVPAKVAGIEYDPNRNANIALLHYVDGEKRYIICPANLNVGDTVKVHVKITEGDKSRIQVFEGTVIAKKHGGINETFTVRRIAYGVGVEKTFPLHSPNVEKVVVVRRGKVRRAKLYYIRERVGKQAKVKELVK